MTRTNKWTVHEAKADSRFFTRNGHFGVSPNSIKKNGSGKGNWGKPGDELQDLVDSGEISSVFSKERRGSNSQAKVAMLDHVQKI